MYLFVFSAADLGIGLWKGDVLHQPEVVPITKMSGHFARGTLKLSRHGTERCFWVTMSICHANSFTDMTGSIITLTFTTCRILRSRTGRTMTNETKTEPDMESEVKGKETMGI